MAGFPSIQAPNAMQQRPIKPQHKNVSSANYSMTRARATLLKREFIITYNKLTKTERDTLETFFNTNSGASFNWTHPETGGATYVVVFFQEGDDLIFEWVAPYYWSVTFTIREV